MYAEVAWALVSSGVQVQTQIIPDPGYLPDYLSVSYDYKKTDDYDSNEKHNIENESQRGIAINKPTQKNKTVLIGRCLSSILNMKLGKENRNNKLKERI